MNQVINNKKWYVYTLSDPVSNIPFYVGKGQKYRMYNHFYSVKKNKPPHGNWCLYRKIKKIIDDGNSIIYTKVYLTNIEKDAYDYEIKLIEEIGIENLCNLFNGYGNVYSGVNHWNFGKTTPLNVKEKIGKAKKGDFHSDETKKKISEKIKGQLHPMYGKKHTEKTRKQMSENHANFNGKLNPFFNKKHSDETKEYFKTLYSNKWVLTLPDGKKITLIGKKSVKIYINDYNLQHNTNISFFSLFQYGKNGNGWTIIKENSKYLLEKTKYGYKS
jgi:hypothetical protein